MSSPRAPTGPRSSFTRRNPYTNGPWQPVDNRRAPQSEPITSVTNAEGLSNIQLEHASSEVARQQYFEVKHFLQGYPFFVLDLVEGTSSYRATISDLTAIPHEFPTEVKAIIITCMLSQKADIERYLLDLRAATIPIVVLCVDEDIRFHTDEILGAHDRFLELGASDMILQSTSNDLFLDLLMRVQSARRANHVRRIEICKRIEEQQIKMFWPFAHRIMEGFPKLSKEYDSEIASRMIGQRIRQGAYGTVFKCVNVASGQEEVVKSIPKTPLNDLKKVNAVWKEIVLLQGLEHPNVVAFYGAKQTATDILIFMEYAGTRNLRSYLKTKHKPANEDCETIETGIGITGQILAGLAHCHEMGVAHRDLKPENIVVMVSDGVMKARIVDFGLATQSTKACTEFVGTVPFIAPEVATRCDNDEYDPACADMWSCGVVFLEVLCGVAKINRMLRWSHTPSSRFKYREDLESFFSIETKLTASVENDIGSVGSVSFPAHAHTSLLGMLTLDPSKRWTATTTIKALTQDTGLSITTTFD